MITLRTEIDLSSDTQLIKIVAPNMDLIGSQPPGKFTCEFADGAGVSLDTDPAVGWKDEEIVQIPEGHPAFELMKIAYTMIKQGEQK